MARKIAFINYKGGVGKTSLIVNVAASLAKAGKRVLLCDFDTQSNAGTRSTPPARARFIRFSTRARRGSRTSS
jgi:cellulose biosynthesis protein BcsQ